MATNILLKSSVVASRIPTTSQLSLRELAVNTVDGKLYLRQGTGLVGDNIYTVNPWNQSTGGSSYNLSFTAGNVGIGTSSPGAKLSVAGTFIATGDATLGGNSLSISGVAGSYTFINSASGYLQITSAGSTLIDSGASGNLILRNSTTERLRIDSSGNVGIGKTNPSTILDVNGTVTATTFSGSGASLTSLPAGQLSGTIPNGVLGNSSLNIGTTSIALNRASANLALTGISSIALPGATSGTVTLQPTATAGTTTITLPATTGTVVTTGDTGSVTSTMILDGTIVNADINASAAIAVSKLAASTISGVTLGNNLNALTIGTGLSGTSYNGSAAVTIAIDSTVATLSGTQTLTNKTFTDSSTTFQDDLDNTKKMQFQLSSITTATTRTLTVPDVNGTIITTGDTGTVTNTMLAGSIANTKLANSTISGVALGSNLNTLTLNVSGTGLSGSTTYNGSAAATFTVTSNATNANTASTIVARDASGNFSAGTITATLSGNASTATTATNVVGTSGQVLYQSGTNTTTTSANLTFNGTNLTVGGTITANSDISLKKNIKTIPNALDKVLSLRGVEFKFKKNNEKSIGVIAQEVEKVVPELVKEGENGIKSVAYQNIVGLLIESIKDLQGQIANMKNEISALKEKN